MIIWQQGKQQAGHERYMNIAWRAGKTSGGRRQTWRQSLGGWTPALLKLVAGDSLYEVLHVHYFFTGKIL